MFCVLCVFCDSDRNTCQKLYTPEPFNYLESHLLNSFQTQFTHIKCCYRSFQIYLWSSPVQSFWTGPYLQNPPYATYSTTLKIFRVIPDYISHKQAINPVLIQVYRISLKLSKLRLTLNTLNLDIFEPFLTS